MPLGLSPSTEFTAFIVSYIVAVLYSMGDFFLYFDYCLGSLYADNSRTVLLSDPYVDMMPFGTIIENGYRGFEIIALGLLFLVWYHYRYHHQKSKSIYLMQRLPAKNALKKRCWSVPVAGILILVVTALILTGIYYMYYITMTPPEFL